MNYRKFKIDKKLSSNLSAEDKKILAILEQVVKDTAVVYEIQKKEGFYPKGITKKQLEKAIKDNPEIGSPFTYIYKNNGRLEPAPYHLKYAPYLIPISKTIKRAAAICTSRSFKAYLNSRAKSLIDGSFREADVAWLNIKNSTIDFSIGPFERYLDKTLFIKRVFQAHVGVVDQQISQQAKQMEEVLYSSAKLSTVKYHSTNIPQKGVRVIWEQTPATAGYMAEAVFSGEHFPSDLDLMEQYGSKILVYQSQFKLKFDRLYYPIFKMIFEKRFAAKYPKELLFKAVGWNILLYELGRQLHKFNGARERLQELYGPIDEANGFTSGIEHSKHLLVKGLLSQDDLEAIIIIHIVWMFADWLVYQHNKVKESHVIGNSILFNTYLSTGALREKEGISWPNFPKIFFEIEAMANQLVHLLQEGTYQEAVKFIRRNADLKSFARLARHLSNLPTTL